MHTDVLAIGAHPDDVELIAGGTIAKLTQAGKRVVIADLTRGEMGTRGTPEIRKQEADAAASVLNIAERISLDLGDGHLLDSFENRRAIVELIRKYRPAIVMTHHWHDLHPDHSAAASIMRGAMYPSGMEKYPAEFEPYRPNEVLFFMGHFPFEPSIIVDVSNSFELKMKAVHCYKSQLHDPNTQARQTGISQPDFLEMIQARARYYGSLIQRKYGEPFQTIRPVPVDDLVEHYKPFSKI